ncbi:uncharacterized protein J8A68_003213 [[Candida] subhashii]|uniref:C2 domain-containing protein n=1 Tax=[Candida] subhashii TaxID=561895 RepID=A0A8J5QAM4_9ASCO|nr:uncharacterized protein J8A68_003213 [[Candida] subhashii]KAG7663299.1 hypothetical protein J8A68_003213 [[Candida] subhashii]
MYSTSSHNSLVVPDIDDTFTHPQSADGTLVILIVRAKNLPNRRKLDKQSPYVVLRLGTVAKKTEEVFRGGQTPEWKQEIRFDLTRDRKPVLKVDVLDDTKGDPTPIGSTDIDCSVIFTSHQGSEDNNGKYIFDKWHELTQNGRRAGLIYLEMTFYPSAPIVPSKIPIYVPEEVVTQRYDYNDDRGYRRSNSSNNDSVQVVRSDEFLHSENSTFSKVSSTFSNKVSETESVTSKNSIAQVFINTNNTHKKTPNRDTNFTIPPITISPTKKNESKFAKLKRKLQTKEPITSFWNTNYELSTKRTPSPLSDYESADLDNLQRDISQVHITDDNSDEDPDEIEFKPPAPPPHLSQSSSPTRKSPRRKPPKDYMGDYEPGVSVTDSTTSIPFSADSIGLDTTEEERMPTKVYLLDKPVKSIGVPGGNNKDPGHVVLNPDEIDPRYYAPTPTEHWNRKNRLQNGTATLYDLKLDARFNETGYLGDGKFSPSVFQRASMSPWDSSVGSSNTSSAYEIDQEDKPKVPPKIPQGLTEMEYYRLEKEKCLRDLNGRRI